ncbi:MAG: cobalamin biosynthesis protein CobD [Nitrospinae bacterium]|nr:cobalamin biosynthesis protein CobD [Nitrospinota bacterium]
MKQGLYIAAALAMDAALGDPRWAPHPVRIIGNLAAKLEGATRKAIGNQKTAGAVTAIAIVGGAWFLSWAVVAGANKLSVYIGAVASVFVIYTTIALRDLSDHAMRVYKALCAGDMEKARGAVAMIVGRDTADLSEEDVARACVESVAESMVDGVTAPIFYAALGGAPLAMAYRAVNTLDSIFGHKDEKYIRFGWASARLDDAANYIPSRLTAPLVALAALILRMDASGAMRTWRRDARKHESPNSGHAESAVAGALGLRLGGTRSYDGVEARSPFIGEAINPLTRESIPMVLKLVNATSVLFAAMVIVVSVLAARLLF